MILTKTTIGLAALVSAGVITSLDVTARSVLPPAPVAVSQQTPPASTASDGTVGLATRADGPANCDQQAWPYISAACLAQKGSAPTKVPTRVIAIDRR